MTLRPKLEIKQRLGVGRQELMWIIAQLKSVLIPNSRLFLKTLQVAGTELPFAEV
jgi:hypothetical protein